MWSLAQLKHVCDRVPDSGEPQLIEVPRDAQLRPSMGFVSRRIPPPDPPERPVRTHPFPTSLTTATCDNPVFSNGLWCKSLESHDLASPVNPRLGQGSRGVIAARHICAESPIFILSHSVAMFYVGNRSALQRSHYRVWRGCRQIPGHPAQGVVEGGAWSPWVAWWPRFSLDDTPVLPGNVVPAPANVLLDLRDRTRLLNRACRRWRLLVCPRCSA